MSCVSCVLQLIAINQDDLGVAGDIIWKARRGVPWSQQQHPVLQQQQVSGCLSLRPTAQKNCTPVSVTPPHIEPLLAAHIGAAFHRHPRCCSFQGCSTEVWAAPISGDPVPERAVVLFNRHTTWSPKTIRVTWAQLGYTATPPPGPSSSSSGPGGPGVIWARVRDLYAGRDLGVFEGGFEARVGSYDVMAIRVTPVEDQGVS